ncbi:MAG: hypothetical protein M2R45_05096 [Verrucomicrobia subdivision 3 bacterium]|nr:hypothetical protein [Limisphaerales bacterium]MCS1417172.1 hypothetical protein [Limisphaerales bacterium]
MFDSFESVIGFLPQPKRDFIMELQQQMSERMMDAAEEVNHFDGSDWKAIREEQKEDLATFLTPEDLPGIQPAYVGHLK